MLKSILLRAHDNLFSAPGQASPHLVFLFQAPGSTVGAKAKAFIAISASARSGHRYRCATSVGPPTTQRAGFPIGPPRCVAARDES